MSGAAPPPRPGCSLKATGVGAHGRAGRALGALLVIATLLVVAGGATAGAGPAGTAIDLTGVQAPSTGEPSTAGPGAGPVADPGGSAALDDLAACVRTSRHLLVLLLIDQTGSLRATDPTFERIVAASSALDSLASLTNGSGPVADQPEVEVRIGGFGVDFQPATDWTPLNAQTLPGLVSTVRSVGRHTDGAETDHVSALSGARDALAQRSALATQGGGAAPCKALLMFTDGRYDLAVRTPQNVGALGSTKFYAPGISMLGAKGTAQVRAAGLVALCRPGGLADGIRSDRTTLITVALAAQPDPPATAFLQSLSTGAAAGPPPTTCGRPSSRPPGAFLSASGIDTLLLRFDEVANRIAGGVVLAGPSTVSVCGGTPCPEGRRSFAVGPSLRRVHVTAVAPSAATQVQIAPPSGAVVTLAQGPAPARVGSVTLLVRRISPRAVAFDITRPAGENPAGWSGSWTVTLVDPTSKDAGKRGTIQVLTFSDIEAALLPGTRLQLDQPKPIEARLLLPGRPKQVVAVRSAQVTAVLDDPLSGGTSIDLPLAPTTKGTFSASFTPPSSITTSYLDVRLRLNAVTTEGVVVSSISAPVAVSVLRPGGYPQIVPVSLSLPSVTGTGRAEGELILVGAQNGDGCVWFDAPLVANAPAGAGPVSLSYGGQATIDRASCIRVPRRTVRRITVDVHPGGRSSGSVQGAVRAFVAPATGAVAIRTDIPFRFDTTRGIDAGKRLMLAALLLAGGLLLPVVLLFLVNLGSTRFQVVDAVRGAALPVVVRRDLVLRPSPDGGPPRPLLLRDADFASLAGAGSARRFSFGGIDFRARPPRNPFGVGHALAAPEGGSERLKGGEGRRVELDLALAGSWIFLLDPDATAVAGPDDACGTVIAFVNEGELTPQLERLVPDLKRRLPDTAGRLRSLVEASVRSSRRARRAARSQAEPPPDDDALAATEAAPGQPVAAPAGDAVQDVTKAVTDEHHGEVREGSTPDPQ